MNNDNDFIIRAKEILAGAVVTPSDIHEFERYIGESMCDSNNWNGNCFTLFGFACAKPEYTQIATDLQDEVNDCCSRGKNALHCVESLSIDSFQDVDWDDENNLYYTFVADAINSIPSYRGRWNTEMKEQISHYEE